jgi:hypothetical protein
MQCSPKVKQNFCLEKLETDEIVDESDQHKQESLFSSLKPDEMKKVLKDVSDGVLSEVKVRTFLNIRVKIDD